LIARPHVTHLERVCASGHRKREMQSVDVSSFLQDSRSSNESVVQRD